MPHGFFYCFVRIMGVLAEFDKLPIEKLFGTLYNGSDESSDIIVDTIDCGQVMSELKKQINYAVVCVNEFAKAHNLTAKNAFQYLYQNKAIEFIKENYAIEHTLSIADAIEDMGMICRNNGGQY